MHNIYEVFSSLLLLVMFSPSVAVFLQTNSKLFQNVAFEYVSGECLHHVTCVSSLLDLLSFKIYFILGVSCLSQYVLTNLQTSKHVWCSRTYCMNAHANISNVTVKNAEAQKSRYVIVKVD